MTNQTQVWLLCSSLEWTPHVVACTILSDCDRCFQVVLWWRSFDQLALGLVHPRSQSNLSFWTIFHQNTFFSRQFHNSFVSEARFPSRAFWLALFRSPMWSKLRELLHTCSRAEHFHCRCKVPSVWLLRNLDKRVSLCFLRHSQFQCPLSEHVV